MSFQTPPFVDYLIAYTTLFATIYGGFNATEGLLRPETKHRIGASLGGRGRAAHAFDPAWPHLFIEFFDTLFVPPKRRTWPVPVPGFLRSVAFSIAFVCLIAVLVFASTDALDQLRLTRDNIAASQVLGDVNMIVFGLVVFAGGAVFYNIIPDYLSIAETRWILHAMKEKGFILAFMAADALFTLSIPFLTIWLAAFALQISPPEGSTILSEYVAILAWRSQETSGNLFNIYIYSTFLTSLWLWLYAFGNVLVVSARGVRSLREFLDRHFLLEERPLSVMGWLLIAAMTVLFVAYLGISLLVEALT